MKNVKLYLMVTMIFGSSLNICQGTSQSPLHGSTPTSLAGGFLTKDQELRAATELAMLDEENPGIITVAEKLNRAMKADGYISMAAVLNASDNLTLASEAIKNGGSGTQVAILEVAKKGIFHPFYFNELIIFTPDLEQKDSLVSISFRSGVISDDNVQRKLENIGLPETILFLRHNRRYYRVFGLPVQNPIFVATTPANGQTSTQKKVVIGTAAAIAGSLALMCGMYKLGYLPPDLLENLRGTVGGYASNLLGTVQNMGQKVWRGATAAMTSVGQSMEEGVKSAGQSLKEAFPFVVVGGLAGKVLKNSDQSNENDQLPQEENLHSQPIPEANDSSLLAEKLRLLQPEPPRSLQPEPNAQPSPVPVGSAPKTPIKTKIIDTRSNLRSAPARPSKIASTPGRKSK